MQTSDFAVSWIVTIRASRASGGASMGQFGHVTSFLSGRGTHLTLRPAVNDRHVDTDLVLKAARKEVT